MSKFSFNTMMMDLDSNIKAKDNYNLNDKRLLERITGDLDFFKERELKIQEFKRNNYDENFGSLPSNNYLSHTPKNNSNTTSTGNLGLAFNTQTFQTEKEIRKIIEREIEPFIFSAKNDLRLNIESFSKEIADYKHFESELLSVKELVQENKRIVLVNQEENERKINDNNYKFKLVSNQFETLKESMFDFSKKIKNFEKIYEEMQEKFINLEDLKQKFSQWENLNEKIFNQIEDQFADKFNNKIKNIETNLENSKTQIIENGLNFNNLNYDVKSMSKQLNSLEQNEKENSNLIKEMKDKFAFFNSDTQGKFDELKKDLNSLTENSRINLKNLTEEIEQNKINQKEYGTSSNRNSHNDKIETLNSNLLEIKLKFEKLIGKVNSLESQIDDISSDFSSNKLEIDEIKKNLKINEIDIKENEERNIRKYAIKTETEKEINELKKIISQNTLNSKNDNYKALNEESRLIRNDFENKFDKIDKEFLKVKDKLEKINNAEQLNTNNNLNISNISKENTKPLNSESLLDIQKLKTQVDEINKTIIFLKEESNRVKNELDNQNINNKEFFDKQSNTNDLFEKTLDEFVNHIAGFETDIIDLKNYKEKNNENLAKIQESFKKVKSLFEKINTLEESQNVLTEGMQEILSNNEEFKSKTEQRFEEIEKLFEENNKQENQENILNIPDNKDEEKIENKLKQSYIDSSEMQNIKKELIEIIEEKDINLLNKFDSLEKKTDKDKDELKKEYLDITDRLNQEINNNEEIKNSVKCLKNDYDIIKSDLESLKKPSENNELLEEINDINLKIKEIKDQINENNKKQQLQTNEKFEELKEKLETAQIQLNTKINEYQSKFEFLNNEIKKFNEKLNVSRENSNANHNINLEDLEEISTKVDEIENLIENNNKKIEETKNELLSTIDSTKLIIDEKFNNTEKQSSNLFTYFEKKSNEIIANFEKKSEDIEDSIKLIVKKIEELEQSNNENNLNNSNNKQIANISKKVIVSDPIEEEINSVESLIKSDIKKVQNFSEEEKHDRILNLTTIEKDEFIPNSPTNHACSVTNIIEKHRLIGSPDQKCEFLINIKDKAQLNKSSDNYLKEKVFYSKNIFGEMDIKENNDLIILPTNKFLKNLQYTKLNPIEFMTKKDEFREFNKKYICESLKYSNYLELEIKACDSKLSDNERLSFLNKNKNEVIENKQFEEEDNLQALEHSIEDVKFDDTFSDYDN